MMKHSSLILMTAAMLLTAGAMPVNAEEPQPATMPVSVEYTEPQPELYGFSADVQEISLGEGETYKLQVMLDDACYYVESLRFRSDHDAAAAVSADGTITAREVGTANICISAKLKEEFVENPLMDTNVRTITVKVTVTPDKSLTPEQVAALTKLKQKGDYLFGEFLREEMVIKGKYPTDAPRLDLGAVEKITASADSYQEICQKLKELQPYPDFIGGSGVSITEYWFDGAGMEKLMLFSPQDTMEYVRCTEDGTISEYQMLYPEETAESVSPILLLGSFNAYHDIAEPIMGDVNGDGAFDICDLILFQKWLLAVPDTKLANRNAADFCADGVLDIYDLCMMKMAVVGNQPEKTKQLTLDTIKEFSKKGDAVTEFLAE